MAGINAPAEKGRAAAIRGPEIGAEKVVSRRAIAAAERPAAAGARINGGPTQKGVLLAFAAGLVC